MKEVSAPSIAQVCVVRVRELLQDLGLVKHMR